MRIGQPAIAALLGALLSVIAGAAALAESATPYRWRSVTVGAGGFVPASYSVWRRRGSPISVRTLGAPALYVIGERDGLTAVWRSTDGGGAWTRINDDQHQWGLRFRVIEGDPRQFGRVYIGTDGRGIVYGDPVRR